jgi:hypothetical protein
LQGIHPSTLRLQSRTTQIRSFQPTLVDSMKRVPCTDFWALRCNLIATFRAASSMPLYLHQGLDVHTLLSKLLLALSSPDLECFWDCRSVKVGSVGVWLEQGGDCDKCLIVMSRSPVMVRIHSWWLMKMGRIYDVGVRWWLACSWAHEWVACLILPITRAAELARRSIFSSSYLCLSCSYWFVLLWS